LPLLPVLGPEFRGTHDHILLSQIRDSPNLEGQVPVFTSRNRVAQLFLQALGFLFVDPYVPIISIGYVPDIKQDPMNIFKHMYTRTFPGESAAFLQMLFNDTIFISLEILKVNVGNVQPVNC
jgi:hypothetical protein